MAGIHKALAEDECGRAPRPGNWHSVIAMITSATGLSGSYPSSTAPWATAFPVDSVASAASRLGNASSAFGMLIAATK